MTTINDVLAIQKQQHILQAPVIPPDPNNIPTGKEGSVSTPAKVKIAATASTLNITIKNNTTSSNCWAYVTGIDINKNAVFILQRDGVTPYYPVSPSAVGSSLAQDCHIPLGAPGSSKVVTIPQIAGGRVWLSRDAQLTFKLNPGPAVVEPSVTNTSDPNYNLFWSFAEFTYNAAQLFANITYVDFVGLPIALSLTNTSGASQTVPGIPSNGLDSVCSALAAQDAKDGAGWSKLIVKTASGANLRALSPNSGIVMNGNLFNGYYQPYVDSVWSQYASNTLTIDTQNKWGVVYGTVTNGNLTFPNVGSFPKPSARDIFSCSSGAFANFPAATTDEMGNIAARLAAALNRSTLATNSFQPAKELITGYYKQSITNHYSRIVHSVCPDGHGYAFPYDDVAPDDAQNVAGTVSDGSPQKFVISFGGLTAAGSKREEVVHVSQFARGGGQQVGGRTLGRRGLEWMSAEEEKVMAASREEDMSGTEMVEVADLEKGLFRRRELETVPEEQQQQLMRLERLVPTALRAKLSGFLEKMEGTPAYRSRM
ncbi:hypothetical protein DL546_003144 [Coniochaeta pulveracea]|uniref:GH64 domain-containing protein n=1 Tax=Coniochaeta pulveracea TaxID=177199 RepID=A0A420Y8L1_9PEZI|nr:hypothetical protein DL546_003144 [Coniochaeta pulveracea]